MCAVGYTLLQNRIIKSHGDRSTLAIAVGANRKGKVSLAAYAIAMPLALVGWSWIAGALLILVALIWFFPDPRIERVIEEKAAAKK